MHTSRTAHLPMSVVNGAVFIDYPPELVRNAGFTVYEEGKDKKGEWFPSPQNALTHYANLANEEEKYWKIFEEMKNLTSNRI